MAEVLPQFFNIQVMKVKIFESCGQYFVYDEEDVLVGQTKHLYILWLGIIINNWDVQKQTDNDSN